MQILITTLGSAGDVHPLLGLGVALKQRGYPVAVIVGEYFRPEVEGAALEFVSLYDAAYHHAVMDSPDLWHPQKSFEVIAQKVILPLMRPLYEILAGYDPKKTLVVASGLAFGARLAQEKLNLPLVTIHLQPNIFLSTYDLPVIPGLPVPGWTPHPLKRWLMGAIDRTVLDRLLAPQTNAFRAELGLPPVQHILTRWIHSPQQVIGLFPDWFGSPQPDWPPNTQLTGFIRYDGWEVHELSMELVEFLEAGEPPVIFTAGTGMTQGAQFFAESVKAVRRLARRAIFLTPHRSQLPTPMPEGIRHFDYVPFSRVLPHAAALVHHGGIGTSAQALAVGTPQLVMPMAHDQPDNAARLERLGVGASIAPQRYQGSHVAEKLEALLNSRQVQTSCQAVAKQVDFSQALDDTCAIIEKLMAK